MKRKYIRVRLKNLTPINDINWTRNQLAMKRDIINNYNPRIKPISVSSDYKVCDGNHRYTILLNHYGGDYTIIVVKEVYTKRVYNFFGIIIGIILILPYSLQQIIKRILGRMSLYCEKTDRFT